MFFFTKCQDLKQLVEPSGARRSQWRPPPPEQDANTEVNRTNRVRDGQRRRADSRYLGKPISDRNRSYSDAICGASGGGAGSLGSGGAGGPGCGGNGGSGAAAGSGGCPGRGAASGAPYAPYPGGGGAPCGSGGGAPGAPAGGAAACGWYAPEGS